MRNCDTNILSKHYAKSWGRLWGQTQQPEFSLPEFVFLPYIVLFSEDIWWPWCLWKDRNIKSCHLCCKIHENSTCHFLENSREWWRGVGMTFSIYLNNIDLLYYIYIAQNICIPLQVYVFTPHPPVRHP